MRKPLTDGENSLMLIKGKNYLVGFVYNPNLDPSETKALPFIKVIGGLEVVNSNLSGTIPTTLETSSEIALGDLFKGETGLETEVSLENFASMVGYSPETLASYGVYDDSLLKYLNPDINRNGLYDVEQENFDWMLTPSRDYKLYADDFTTQKPVLSIEDFQDEDFHLVFWFTRNLPHVNQSQVYLTFPNTQLYKKYDGNIVNGMNATYDVPAEKNDYQQYYFSRINLFMSSPRPPYNGDYHLRLGSQEYDFEQIRLLSPWENSFEGFLFPQSTFMFDDQGYLQKIKYKWWVVKDGLYKQPSLDELKLRIGESFHFYYYLPESRGGVIHPATLAVSGELQVSGYEIHRSEMTVPGQPRPEGMNTCFVDTAGNEWSFINHISKNRGE